MLTVEHANTFDWKNIPLKDCLDGNALDTYFTAKVYHRLLEDVQKKDLEYLYEKLISPLTSVFLDIEMRGILIDQDRLDEIDKELEGKIEEVEEELLSSPYIKEGTNLGSTNDLCKVLYSLDKVKNDKGVFDWLILEDEGFGLFPFKYTAKGAPSTNEEAIVAMAEMVEEEYVRRGLSA